MNLYVENPTLNRFLVNLFCGSAFFGWVWFVMENATGASDYVIGTLMGIAILGACSNAYPGDRVGREING